MSYLLDTNIVSGVRRGAQSHPQLWRWYNSVSLEEVYLSVIVCGELRRGVESLRRRDPMSAQALDRWLNGLIVAHAARILPLTFKICELWGRNPLLWPLQAPDALIAATAQHHGLTLVSRNERDFQKSGVDFLNPFEA